MVRHVTHLCALRIQEQILIACAYWYWLTFGQDGSGEEQRKMQAHLSNL